MEADLTRAEQSYVEHIAAGVTIPESPRAAGQGKVCSESRNLSTAVSDTSEPKGVSSHVPLVARYGSKPLDLA